MSPMFNIAQAPLGARPDQVPKMMAFILAGLGLGFTSLQESAFLMITKILMVIPDATIYTLLAIIADRGAIEPYMDKLPENVRQWVMLQYDSDGGKRAREGLAEKAWAIVNSDLIGAIMTGERNTLDIMGLMQAKKTVVVTIDKEIVRDDTSIIARPIIAAFTSAMWRRPNPAPAGDPDWILIADEFADLVGPLDNSQPEVILSQGRERRISIIVAHQMLEGQVDKGLRAGLEANTWIKAYANVVSEDATRFAPGMGVSKSDMMNFSTTEDWGYFCLWANGYIPTGVKTRIPFGFMQKRPRMSDRDFKAMEQAQRNFWAKVNGQARRAAPIAGVASTDGNVIRLASGGGTPKPAASAAVDLWE
jgi:hypothetical protein